jgi:hypothetical protein
MKIFMFSVDTSNVVAPGVEGFKAYNFSDTCAVPGFDWFKSNRIVYRHSETADTSMLSPMQQESPKRDHALLRYAGSTS